MSASVKFAVFVSLLISTVAFADTEAPSEYPLRVHILEHYLTTNIMGRLSGSGYGNIENGDSWQGFDYTWECARLPDVKKIMLGLTFMGRWKKPETLLAIPVGKPPNQEECELKTKLRDVVYGKSGDHLLTYTLEQYAKVLAIRKALDQVAHPTDVDPTHFPVSVTILEAQWQDLWRVDVTWAGAVAGVGRGNIQNGSSIMAFDFDNLCPSRLIVNLQGAAYQGRWQQEPTRLLVLAHAIGGVQGFQQCELHTTVHPTQVYMRNPSGVMTALTQEQYKSLLDARNPQPKSSSPVTPGGP